MGRIHSNNPNRPQSGVSRHDDHRRRLIRRVLVGWLTLTLIAAVFYAYSKTWSGRPLHPRGQNARQVAP